MSEGNHAQMLKRPTSCASIGMSDGTTILYVIHVVSSLYITIEQNYQVVSSIRAHGDLYSIQP